MSCVLVSEKDRWRRRAVERPHQPNSARVLPIQKAFIASNELSACSVRVPRCEVHTSLRARAKVWIHAAMRKPIIVCTVSLSALFGCADSPEQRVFQASPRDSGVIASDDAATDQVSSDIDSISDPSLDASVIPSEPTPPADVQVAITSDNAFSFGYGDEGSVTTFIQGVASGADQIFNCPVGYGPQTFVVPGDQAPEDAYLYVVTWADRDWTQGTLAQFKRAGGSTIYSGDAAWQVCATGREYDPDSTTGPDQATVNEYVQACNAGATGATFSRGWVSTSGAFTDGARGKLAQGEANDDAGGDFPVVCQQDDAGVPGIDAQASWMWFDPEDGSSAFKGNANNRTQAFLIFRLPALLLL